MKALAIALLSNARQSSLTWLGLGGNEITDRGVEHLGVALMAQRSQPTEDTDGNEGESALRLVLDSELEHCRGLVQSECSLIRFHSVQRPLVRPV